MPAKGKGQNAEPEEQAIPAEVEEILNTKVQEMRPAQRAFYEMLLGIEQIATEDLDSGAFMGDDLAGILTADSESDMWDADEKPRFNAKVLSGCEMELYGWEAKFSPQESEIESGLIGPEKRRKMYLLVHAARINSAGQDDIYRLPEVGEDFVWNTSARFIVAKLYWLLKRGYFDNGKAVKVRIQGTDLGSGKSVEKLKPLTPVTVDQPAF